MIKLQVEILKKPDKLVYYSKFINDHPLSTYFQTHDFYRVCASSKKITSYIIIAESNKEIVGALQFFTQYQLMIPLINRMTARNIIWGGPIALNNSPDVIGELLRAYDLYFSKKALYTQVRNLFNTMNYQSVFELLNFSYSPHLNIIIDLTKSEEELWEMVNSKRKNEIRKAIKEGITFELDQSIAALKDCYNILKEVYSGAKLPLPHFSHFFELYKHSVNNSGLRICTVKNNRQIIGCMLALVYKETVYDYFAGSLKKYYNKCPNDLIPWEVFRWAKRSGYKKFDFGGAGNPGIPYGVRNYKKQFGGTLVNYGRYEKIHKPLLFSFAKVLFRIWQKIKLN